MLTDIKLSKTLKASKIIHSGGFFGVLTGKFCDPLMTVAVPLVKNVIARLAFMESAFAQDGAVQRKMLGRGIVTAGIALVI